MSRGIVMSHEPEPSHELKHWATEHDLLTVLPLLLGEGFTTLPVIATITERYYVVYLTLSPILKLCIRFVATWMP